MQTLRTQLILKGIIVSSDWDTWKESITFDFIEDNYFAELKEAEIWRERFEMLATLDEYVGKYISNEWVRKKVLRFTDDDIKDIQAQIDDEEKSGENEPMDADDPRWD